MRLVVVGSGIVGAACAHAACELGAEVTMVDADMAGKATAAGAGIICPWSSRVDDPVWYSFACAAAREYPGLVAGLRSSGAGDVSYRQVGALLLSVSSEHAELVAEQMLARRERAPEIGDVQVLDEAQARMLFPPLSGGSPAVFVGGAARVDGRRIAAALAAAAASQGMVTRTGTASLVLEPGLSADAGRSAEPGQSGQLAQSRRVRGVLLDGELLEADAVVAAAGAWTRELLEPAGVTVRVTAERGQIMHISMGSADTSDWPVVLPMGSAHYLLAFDDSRVVVGATREADAGFDYRVTPDGLHEVLTQALSVAPGLGSGSYLETRVGFRPVGPDNRPLLGAVAGVHGLVVATGLGASGLTMGPYAGAIAAKLALGKDPGIDLTPFDPLRGT